MSTHEKRTEHSHLAEHTQPGDRAARSLQPDDASTDQLLPGEGWLMLGVLILLMVWVFALGLAVGLTMG